MRLLHFAGLHLEHSYASDGVPSVVGRDLRSQLQATLRQVLALAVAERVDLIVSAGGLYEHAHATARTAAFLRESFDRCPIPVLLVPGQADPFLPGSLYQLTTWPKAVTVAGHPDLRPYRFGSATLWCAGQASGARALDALPAAPADPEGPHLLVLPDAAASLEDAAIEAAGYAHAMLGALGAPFHSPRRTSPGSPAALAFQETAHAHGVALLKIEGAAVEGELRPLAADWFIQHCLDVTGQPARAVRMALHEWLAASTHRDSIVSITLTGDRPGGESLPVEALEKELGSRTRYLRLVDATGMDARMANWADDRTARAEFWRRLMVGSADSPNLLERELALDLGLRALRG